MIFLLITLNISKNFDSANSLYLIFHDADAYIEKNDEDKYLIFASIDKNKEALENCIEFWDEVKDQIELINCNKPSEYKKTFYEN